MMETWEEVTKNNSELSLIRTANQCIKEAEGQPDLKPLFGTLWQMGELTFLAGDTGKGKTILSVSIADSISKGLPALLNQQVGCQAKVLYYDFELNDRQFSKRYNDYKFSDDFYRIVVSPIYLGFDKFSIETIQRDVEATDANVIIIDNITALALKSTQSQDESLNLMKDLKTLALQGLSILVLSHTPKVAEGSKLTINHLAGSKHLSNFADSVFFIGQSRENPDYRYLKQVKSRNAEQLNEVIVCELLNEQGRLFFDFVKYDNEDSHIAISNAMAGIQITEEMEKAYEFHKQGKSLRAIARELGVGKSTIDRWLKSRPLSHVSENSESGSAGQQKDSAGQFKNDHGTSSTEGQNKAGINHKQETIEQAGQKFNLVPLKKRTSNYNGKVLSARDKVHSGTTGHRDKALKPLENERGTRGQSNISGTEKQRDGKRDLPPLSIEIVRNGRTITVHHPELKRIMYGDNWMNILYPENGDNSLEYPQEKKKVKPVYSAFDKDNVEKINKEFKKWILKMIRFHRNGEYGVEISEFKAMLENIKEIQDSFDYRYLPENYEYFSFIEELKAKLQRLLVLAKVENLKKIKPILEESYIEEMKQILYDLGE